MGFFCQFDALDNFTCYWLFSGQRQIIWLHFRWLDGHSDYNQKALWRLLDLPKHHSWTWDVSSQTFVRTHHMFSRILNFLFTYNCFFNNSVILAFYNLFWFLNENLFRTDQGKRQISWKEFRFSTLRIRENMWWIRYRYAKKNHDVRTMCSVWLTANSHIWTLTTRTS